MYVRYTSVICIHSIRIFHRHPDFSLGLLCSLFSLFFCGVCLYSGHQTVVPLFVQRSDRLSPPLERQAVLAPVGPGVLDRSVTVG